MGRWPCFRRWPALVVAKARGETLPWDLGHARLRALTGTLSLAFALALTSQAFVTADATELYERLRDVLARSPTVFAYAMGAAALTLTLAEGVSSAARRRGGGGITTVLAWAVALALFAAQAHGLGHFAAGRGLFASPVDAGAPP